MIYLGEIIELRENDISFNLDISIILDFWKTLSMYLSKEKKIVSRIYNIFLKMSYIRRRYGNSTTNFG